MDAPTILSVTAAAAAFLKKPVQDAAGKIIFDGYETLKKRLKTRSNDSPDVIDALEKLENKPDSKARLELLTEELSGCAIEKDPAIIEIAKALIEALPPSVAATNVQVSIKQVGRGHKAQVAGRDIINTEHHTEVIKFTPDERHITAEQCEKIRKLIEKLAIKIASEDGKPNFRDAWGRLYNKFKIGTYRELQKEDFEAAISYLQTQGALNRSRLRRSNPQAYRNDLYTPIWAKMKSLGWEKPAVYTFAQEKLALKKPITSLKQLGPNQLKSLYEQMMRQ